MATTAFVALGSNLGDRDAQLAFAVRALEAEPGVQVAACSPVYETAPVGPADQGPYLNAVVRVETRLSARALLAALQRIETRAGRRRAGQPRWGARTLDLDLLLFGETCADEPGLTVPHPRLAERSFVLVPLADLAADLAHPESGRTIAELLAALPGARPGRLPEGVRAWQHELVRDP